MSQLQSVIEFLIRGLRERNREVVLIECPECGSQVSDRAKCCPHCGYSLEDVRNEQAAEEAAIIAQKNQAAYDATFRPNEIYLASPMPFKALFRAFTTRGRASRAEFWSFFVVFVISESLMLLMVGKCKSDVLGAIVCLMTIWEGSALLTAISRRQHDAGHENIGCLMMMLAFVCLLIPVIGWLVFLALMIGGCGLFDPSESGSNEHGPHPDVFYYTNPERPVPRPQMKQIASQQIHREPPVAQRNAIVFNCPCCGKECESEEEIQVGQHVICPYCEKKFSYFTN